MNFHLSLRTLVFVIVLPAEHEVTLLYLKAKKALRKINYEHLVIIFFLFLKSEVGINTVIGHSEIYGLNNKTSCDSSVHKMCVP